MLRRITLIVSALALVIAAQTPAGDAKKTDAHGDALPDGALARLGSLRWRHSDVVTFVAFPDAKTVLTAAADNVVRLWDRETGKEIRRLDTAAAGAFTGVNPRGFAMAGTQARIALAPDGKIVANLLPNNSIQLLSLETGKEIRQLQNVRINISSVHLSPDRKVIAARASDRATHLLDAETGKELRQIRPTINADVGVVLRLGNALPSEASCAFAPDGKTIATAEMQFDMQKPTPYLRFTEVATGKEIRRIDTPQGASALAYSPNGKIFAHAVGNFVHFKEADTGKEIRTINLQGGTGAASLVFSPDNQTLAVRGRDRVVRLFEVETGKGTHTLGDPAAPLQGNNLNGALLFLNGGGGGAEPRDVAFSTDSKILALGGQQALRFFNVATGKEQGTAVAANDVSDGHRAGVTAVLVAPDGKTTLTRGNDRVIRRWDAAGKEIGVFVEPAGTNFVMFAPDARRVAVSNVDGSIRIVDAVSGKQLHQLRGHQNGATALAFSPDGKLLASRSGSDNVIRIFDIEKGVDVRQISIVLNTPAVGGPRGVQFASGGQGLAFSADGQTIAAYIGGPPVFARGGGAPAVVNIDTSLRLWDVSTGKQIRKINFEPERLNVVNIAFSPDGRVLAAENLDQTVSLWELASGKERGVFGQPTSPQTQPGFIVVGGNIIRAGVTPPSATTTLTFSPDGSLVAVRGPKNIVRFWDVDAAREIEPLQGHTGEVLALAFAPDGRSLASASADTTVLVWDVDKLKRGPKVIAAPLQPKDLEALWADLIGDDAVRADKSIRALAGGAKEATPLLRDRVKPAAPPDLKKIDQLILDLDSTVFTKRSKAAEELERLGELALPALQKAMTSSKSLELRRRVEPILEKVLTGALSAEQMRMVRAIEALEKMRTTEARTVLDGLAQGAAGALQTRHAQAALDRLGKPQ